eukprot:Tamp_11412.p1 GENE.Tamp_11412~~Tamp_11412.p1  ORF type:complete len:266 (+),score=17.53 Tamp_11412:713-1510(+)
MTIDSNLTGIFKKKFFSNLKYPIIIKSKFTIIFPKYQEKNLLEKWSVIHRILRFYNIDTDFSIKKGEIIISTTKRTSDPYSILNARDFLKLISRGVPIHQAAQIFDEHVFCDIVKISGFIRNKKIFLNRRKRMIGNNGSTVKVIELLTKSYILVQGNTVSCMGNFKNIKLCRKIIEDCMKNIHPYVNIRDLILRKKLFKSSMMKNKSWNTMLPLKSIENSNDRKLKIQMTQKNQNKDKDFFYLKNYTKKQYEKPKFLEKRQNFIF